MESEDFKEWLKAAYEGQYISYHVFWEIFESYPFEMKWGVYLKYFNEKKVYIDVCHYYQGDSKSIAFMYDINEGVKEGYAFETHLEAQQEAVKKAFKILEDETNKI